MCIEYLDKKNYCFFKCHAGALDLVFWVLYYIKEFEAEFF